MTMGIYRITCKENNKCYIGSSINIEKRLKQHKKALENETHNSNSMQLDYDYPDFTFTTRILERVDNEFILLEREAYYIALYNSIQKGYNTNKSKSTKTSFEQLETLKNAYYKQVKNSPIKIKLPDIYNATTKRQLNLQIKIFTILCETDIVLNTTYIKKMKKKIIPDSLTAKMRIDCFTIDSISIIIDYILTGGCKKFIYFNISEIYKLMKDKKIEMREAILKYISNFNNIQYN